MRPGHADASPVSRANPLPLYAQLADLLRQQIADGVWAPGDALPSEGELCALHDVSRTAVRQALANLVDEGLVHKERGRGTFVRREAKAGLVIQEVMGLADELAMHGQQVRTRVTRLAVEPLPADAAVLLQVPMGSDGLRLDRVRSVDEGPIATTQTWLPLPRFDFVRQADLEAHSLYEVLRREAGVRPVAGYRKLEAVPASATVADDLEVRRGSPVLRMTATNEDEDRRPFEWFVAWYHADRVSFEMLVATADARLAAEMRTDTAT